MLFIQIALCQYFCYEINHQLNLCLSACLDQAPVVQRLDNAIHQINHYPMDKCRLDSDLPSGYSVIHLLNNPGQIIKV